MWSAVQTKCSAIHESDAVRTEEGDVFIFARRRRFQTEPQKIRTDAKIIQSEGVTGGGACSQAGGHVMI